MLQVENSQTNQTFSLLGSCFWSLLLDTNQLALLTWRTVWWTGLVITLVYDGLCKHTQTLKISSAFSSASLWISCSYGILGLNFLASLLSKSDLALQARPLLTRALDDGNFDDLVDPKLQKQYNHNEMARIVACAAACVRHSARRRPRMSQVIGVVKFLSNAILGIEIQFLVCHVCLMGMALKIDR